MAVPKNEQTICVSCRFCCDGTLFEHAHLKEMHELDLIHAMDDEG